MLLITLPVFDMMWDVTSIMNVRCYR